MRKTQQFSVTLPNEMAALVRAKVASGEYASEGEVIREGLRALNARECALDDLLRTQACRRTMLIAPIRREGLRWRMCGHPSASGKAERRQQVIADDLSHRLCARSSRRA